MISGRPGVYWRAALLFLAVVLSAALGQWRFTTWADAHLHDTITRWLPEQPPSSQLLFIDIDERSIAELGPWPWPRPVIAQLMQNLRQRGVRLQIWDLFLSMPASGDERLNAQLQNPAKDIVLGQVLVTDPQIHEPPHEGRLLSGSAGLQVCADNLPIAGYLGVSPSLHPPWVGHITATPDADGRLRRVPAVLCAPEALHYPQLVLAAAEALEPEASWQLRAGSYPFGPAHWLERASLRFPLDEHGLLTIPYRRPHNAWPAVSAVRLFDASAKLPLLRGKIVIIGATALGLGDTVSTPYHPTAPGASVHAELLDAALSGGWTVPPRANEVAAAVVAMLSLFGIWWPLARWGQRHAFSLLVMAAGLGVPLLLGVGARQFGLLLPVAAPTLALAACFIGLIVLRAETQRRQSRRLADHLESFLPRDLAREIARQNPSGESLGHPLDGTLLGLQVVGLERWTGAVEPLRGLALVHAVSTLAHRIASQHGAALEHVQGETFLLVWPRADAGAVKAAMTVARDIFKELTPILQHNEKQTYPLGARIAIESGAFLQGIAGARVSRRPLLLGPTVATVLAMLALSDELASPVLLGPRAAHIQSDVPTRSLGQFLLPDQAQAKSLYRIELEA